jgi:uncharacterized protein YijF (DUF1287 family)
MKIRNFNELEEEIKENMQKQFDEYQDKMNKKTPDATERTK